MVPIIYISFYGRGCSSITLFQVVLWFKFDPKNKIWNNIFFINISFTLQNLKWSLTSKSTHLTLLRRATSYTYLLKVVFFLFIFYSLFTFFSFFFSLFTFIFLCIRNFFFCYLLIYWNSFTGFLIWIFNFFFDFFIYFFYYFL